VAASVPPFRTPRATATPHTVTSGPRPRKPSRRRHSPSCSEAGDRGAPSVFDAPRPGRTDPRTQGPGGAEAFVGQFGRPPIYGKKARTRPTGYQGRARLPRSVPHTAAKVPSADRASGSVQPVDTSSPTATPAVGIFTIRAVGVRPLTAGGGEGDLKPLDSFPVRHCPEMCGAGGGASRCGSLPAEEGHAPNEGPASAR